MIIIIGFPKSGTSSFQKLFQTLGYRSYHWKKDDKYIGMMIYKNKINKKPLLHDFLETDVITQMDICINDKNCYWPQLVDYKQLYTENPDSIFILNKRNPEKLLSSFKRWNKLDERLYLYNPELIDDKSDNGFINFVNKFYKDVEYFFSLHPKSKFITYDINEDNIEKLKKYIDIKEIKEFPKENVNTNK